MQHPASSWHLVVDRHDLSISRLIDLPQPASLEDGTIRLRIERLALTANVLTYGRSGDALGFWSLFDAPPGWGALPAWGHAVVERSAHPDFGEGERYFGLLPMASHLTLLPKRTRIGLRDDSPRRAAVNSVYNQYAAASTGDAARLEQEALLRPLLITSYVLARYLREQAYFGADAVWITSASSKTALGFAHSLRGERPATGFTSAANLGFTQASGCYDAVLTYDEVEEAGVPLQAVLVDFSGDEALLARIAQAVPGRLARVLRIGSTHWQVAAPLRPRESADGLPQEFFFGPDHVLRLIGAEGPQRFEQGLQDVLAGFAARLEGRYARDVFRGAAGLQQAYDRLAHGALAADRLCIVEPA